MLPLRAPGQRYPRYTSAVRRRDRPWLFENRPSCRLLGADLMAGRPFPRGGLAGHFDSVDLTEAVSHESAMAARDAEGMPTWSELPLRSLVGDPFDLRRRNVLPGIDTLSPRRERRTGGATSLRHRRDPAEVACAGDARADPRG